MSSNESVIHDIGYRRYRGQRLGRAYARRSLFVHSVRTAFGLRRTGKAKIFPWLAIGLFMLIAAVDVVVRTQANQVLIPYLNLPRAGLPFFLLFLASAAPELVSRDLRNRVLPLYFSRPLRRSDYATAKLSALVVSAWLVLAVPMATIFAGGVFTVAGWHAIWHETVLFLQGLALAAIYAIIFGVLSLLIASLMKRRMAAAGVIIGVFLVTAAIGGAIGGIIGGDHGVRVSLLFNPGFIAEGLKYWLFDSESFDVGNFGPLYLLAALGVTIVGSGLVLLRYRKVAA